MSDHLAIGDRVFWRDGWGTDGPEIATVQVIWRELIPGVEEYVLSIPWAEIDPHGTDVTVILDTGKWAYAGQLGPVIPCNLPEI